MTPASRAAATVTSLVAAALLFQLPAFARCPVNDGATLVVHAPVGNLHVDTTGQGAVDVSLTSSDMIIKEICSKDRVEYNASDAPIRGGITWNIVVPRNVNLDLTTFGGSITMGDSDGSAKLRTTSGSITVGRIKGQAFIISQGGFIKAGDIGSHAELRISSAGSIEVGNIAGDADLHTAGGPIRTGLITGKVTADTSGDIYIQGAGGEVSVSAEPGAIYIGDAARIVARSGGGNITNPKVRGSVKAHTDSGDIRLDAAGGWVEASTGFGTIFVRLAPTNLDGDLHVNLQTAIGNITIFIPERMKANIESTVDRPTLTGQSIYWDLPAGNALTSGNRLAPPNPTGRFLPITEQRVVQGGGNSVKLHTSLGKIEIKISR